MAKPKSVLKRVEIKKVGKSLYFQQSTWDGIQEIKDRIKKMDLGFEFEANEIAEQALIDALEQANKELDAIAKSKG